MKTQRTVVVVAFLFSICLHASAQQIAPPLNTPNYSKARIFTDLPEKMSLRIADAASLLDLPVGTRVNATIANGFPVTGIIVSKSNPADTSIKSVVISTDRKGAIFTFTRTKAADGTVSYLGRLLNRANGDALEIAKEAQGYVIRKKGIYEMMNE
jgi:hypothetical protein